MKILTLIAIFATISLTQYTHAMINIPQYSTNVIKSIAIVDNSILTNDDLNQQINLMKLEGVSTTDDALQALALESLIDKVIILNTSQLSGKTIPQHILNAAVEDIAHKNNLTTSEFNAVLQKAGIRMDSFIETIKTQMLWNEIIDIKNLNQNKALKQHFQSAIITKQQIAQYDAKMSEYKIEYTFNKNSQVNIAEILVTENPNLSKILEMLKAKKSFKDIKRQFPQNITLANNDGNIGWLQYTDMSSEYQKVIASTKIGDLTEPLVLNNNILFIKLLDIKDVEIKKIYNKNPEYLQLSYNDKAEMLYDNIQRELYAQQYMRDLRNKSFIQILE